MRTAKWYAKILAERSEMGLPGGPIIEPKPPRESLVPLRPVMRWVETDSGALFKRYQFKNNVERNRFVRELLDYEESTGHLASIKVSDKEVLLSVTTHDVGMVTELDREFANNADVIYRDVVETTGCG